MATLSELAAGKAQPNTARVRRGFGIILGYLAEDIDHDVASPRHPLSRRAALARRSGEVADIQAALVFMRQHADQERVGGWEHEAQDRARAKAAGLDVPVRCDGCGEVFDCDPDVAAGAGPKFCAASCESGVRA